MPGEKPKRSESLTRNSRGPCDAAGQEHDGGGIEECGGRCDGRLEVFGEASVAVDPGEEALDDPAPWQDGEADLVWQFVYDLDGDAGGVGDSLGATGAIGEGEFDEWKGAARSLQQESGAIAILNVGGVNLEDQGSAIGVDHDMTLAAPRLRGGRLLIFLPASPGSSLWLARGQAPPLGPPALVVLTLWLSMTAAEGLASRPTRSRSIIRR
jgi:hypothetical protein